MTVELYGTCTKVEAWEVGYPTRTLTGIKWHIDLEVGYATVTVPLAERIDGSIGDTFKVTIEPADISEEE